MAEERDDVDVAWARIVADYDREVTDPVGRWPVEEDLPDPADESAASGRASSGAVAAAPTPEPADDDLLVPPGPAPAAADPDWTDYDGSDPEGSGSGHHYVPPDPPPLGRPDLPTGIAWAGVLGGPVMLLLAAALAVHLPSLLTAACVIGFVGGVIFLVVTMDDGPGRDGWDDGAQV